MVLLLGADILRLSKDELITLCGLAEGIRLFNALQYKYVGINFIFQAFQVLQNFKCCKIWNKFS